MTLDERARQASRAVHVAVEGVSPNPLPSRRVIAARRAAIALVLIAIVSFFSNLVLDNLLANLRVETADQPPSEVKEETSGEDGKSDSSAPVPVSSVAPGQAGGTSSSGPKTSSKDSRPGGSLPAGPAPQRSEIAFIRRGEIHLMDADGSNVRKLRAGAGPGWSPDGKSIAFHDHWQEGGDVQLINADGSGYQNLRARGFSPSWSPNGDQLAFSRECDEQGPECGIGVVGRDGTGDRRLGNGTDPDWGPDGRIIFTDGMPTGACYHQQGVVVSCGLPLWVMNPDGSGRTRLPVDRAVAPTWSHDGRKIAYYTPTDGVFIANSDGTGIVKVAPAGYEEPSWSPDSLWLAVTGYTTNPDMCAPGRACQHNIYLRGIDGSSEKRLTNSNNDTSPAFSPRR